MIVYVHAKKILITLSVAVLVCAVLVIIFAGSSIKQVFNPGPPGPPPTFAPAPANIKVPSAGESISNHDISSPVAVAPSTTNPGEVVRTFNVRAFNNNYDHNTIIVNDGDLVKINFTAVDDAYDLTIPVLKLQVSAKKGETKLLEFKATPAGKYLFYCDLCGGINSSMHGYLIIAAKAS